MLHNNKKSISSSIFRILNILFMIILILITVLPILNTFTLSFSTDIDSMVPGVKIWPSKFSTEGYYTLFQQVKILRPFLNNIIVTVCGTILHVGLCALTGYALSKNMAGKKIIMGFILITMMIPLQNIMIPLYILYKNLHLIDKLIAIIISGIVSGYSIVLLKNFFESIPESIGEAAYIDGASQLKMFIRIYLPLAKPGIATVALFQFVGRWNHFMEAVLFINDPKKYTLQIALKGLVIDSDASSSATIITKNTQMAGVMIAIIPLLILYPFLQKYFISGLMVGSTKG